MSPVSRMTTPLIVAAGAAALLPLPALAQTIVWTDANAGRIQRKDVNGGDVQTIVQFPSPDSPSEIHYDPVTAKLYYLFVTNGTLVFQRANLDGSNPENIPTPSAGTFALNVTMRKLYWIVDFAFPNNLYRSDMNGAQVETHTYPSCCIFTIEAPGDDIFFGTGSALPKGIWRADADGSNELFLHGNMLPFDLAFDPVENKIYVADYPRIDRLNTDGTDYEVVVDQLNSEALQVEVDYRSRKLYWVDADSNGFTRIQRSNLDGSSVEEFVTASDAVSPNLEIVGLTIVYGSTPIPTVSGWGIISMTVLLLSGGLVVLKKRAKVGW